MGRESKWAVVEDTPKKLVIKDLGPWDEHLSITNDAENVVSLLHIRLKIGWACASPRADLAEGSVVFLRPPLPRNACPP